MVRTNPLALAARDYDSRLYFDNAASYHIFYNIHDFDNPYNLPPYISLQDDITLADKSVISSEKIEKV